MFQVQGLKPMRFQAMWVNWISTCTAPPHVNIMYRSLRRLALMPAAAARSVSASISAWASSCAEADDDPSPPATASSECDDDGEESGTRVGDDDGDGDSPPLPPLLPPPPTPAEAEAAAQPRAAKSPTPLDHGDSANIARAWSPPQQRARPPVVPTVAAAARKGTPLKDLEVVVVVDVVCAASSALRRAARATARRPAAAARMVSPMSGELGVERVVWGGLMEKQKPSIFLRKREKHKKDRVGTPAIWGGGYFPGGGTQQSTLPRPAPPIKHEHAGDNPPPLLCAARRG
jgi:hypothetical protein